MKFHRISLVFLLLTVHPVFSGHLFLLTSCKSLALILFSVLASSVQVHHQFGIPFLTLSVHPIHLTLSGSTWKHTIPKLLLIPPSGKPQRLWFTCELWLMALYKCIYLLTYLMERGEPKIGWAGAERWADVAESDWAGGLRVDVPTMHRSHAHDAVINNSTIASRHQSTILLK